MTRGHLAKSSRYAVHQLLMQVKRGGIELHETWSRKTYFFGSREADLQVVVHVRTPSLYPLLLRYRSVAIGRGYAEGMFSVNDPVALMRIAAREIRKLDRFRHYVAPLTSPAQWLTSMATRNTKEGARKNIAAHYDLGNDLFELFLDRETMMYSSAYFSHPGMSLEDAQKARLQRICDKLELTREDHVLEIGTGWGGFAIYAATHTGCRVTTTTISREQYVYAAEKVEAAGLSDLITVMNLDYRDVTGKFTKLVSLEMIEAVGWEYFNTFFRCCANLLTNTGLMFLQAITVEEQAFEGEKSTKSFANTLIFPGGCLPSLGAIQKSTGHYTDLHTIWLDDIGASYALTLRHWRERFCAAQRELDRLGYDRAFQRLWEMYFAISEAGFLERRLGDLQMVFAKTDRPVSQQ